MQNDTHNSPGHRVPGRVLVVEDHIVNQKVVASMLKRLGFECDVAPDGEQALEFIQKHHYHLVLMDCQMPVLDGYAATATLRERERANGQAKLPVIALTANALVGDRERCLAAGMDDFLSKPVRLQTLEAMIVKWCPVVRAAQADSK